MYEIRQEQRKRMREHKFFYHFILAIGIFVYSQGCQLMPGNAGYASTAIFLGIIMHHASVEKLFKRIFKFDAHNNAKIVMLLSLFIIAVASYFIELGFIPYVLLDLICIILFTVTALIYQKLKKRQE